ncbi:MAG: hypothetical protein M1830_008899 [Pleopsidium flavum]|nr:MAG: hypothetical protein M1830_008899 [Pleopsidium flavum]
MESYERTNAREWQLDNDGQPLQDSENSEGSDDLEEPNDKPMQEFGARPKARSNAKHTTPGHKARGPISARIHRDPKLKNTFSVEKDNEAKAAWRKGQPWTGFYDLPTTYDQIDQSIFRKAQSTPGVRLAKPYAVLEDIGLKVGAYIQPPRSYSDRRLHIWGNHDQVVAVKEELMRWIKRSPRSSSLDSSNANFIKVHINSEGKQRMLDIKMQKEAVKQKYRQAPEDSAVFLVNGFFAWPADQLRPDEVFGKNFEAFDPVRMAYRCHIIFDTESSMFKVLSNNPRAVQEALRRIRTTVCELVSRSSRPTRLYLLVPPTLTTVKKQVDLIDSQSSEAGPRLKPVLIGQSLTQGELGEWAQLRPKLLSANESCIQRAVLHSLSSVRFYRGHVRMRIHFGSFVFSVYKKPSGSTHSLEEFMQMMGSSTTAGALVKDLDGGNGETDLITQCQQATRLFAPIDVMTSSLEDVQPVYSAMFEFATGATDGVIRLEIEFSKASAEGDFDISRQRWIRLDGTDVETGGLSTSPPLDLNLVALEGSASWQLQITAYNGLDETRVAPEIREFAQGIRLDADHARSTPVTETQQLVQFPTNLPVRAFIQKTGFRYRLRNSTYLFEIARYQQFPTSASEMATKSTSESDCVSTWGASFFNEEWDMILGQNAHLGIGEAGKWRASLNTFFPKDVHTLTSGPDAGFHDFLKEVGKVAELLELKGN